MKQYLIKWNAGFGETTELVDVDNKEEALEYARQEWQQEVESNADYGVVDFTIEKAYEYGIEEEHPDYMTANDPYFDEEELSA